MSILDEMRAGVQYRFPITLRRAEIWMRPLTTNEQTNVAVEVAHDLRSKPHLQDVGVSESVLLAIKTLAMASTSAPGAKDMVLHEAVLQELTIDELMYLFKQYNGIVDRVNPSLEKIDDERFEALLELAKKNPTALTDCSFVELVGLCQYLIRTMPQADK